ncbi:hypothetical protein KIN20_026312 [Parelaphostrongylus tenuis]|uniref:Uncharacterized protein n=1 Tax=Parelaphostrongylus tenuis TaxID=148309 RepID=A0AAD5MWI5_PARTN|nr:hypothetical protein KIN20_026312 [Parelaphostrongylus tenuis]
MGSSMRKDSNERHYHPIEKQKTEIGNHFSKQYSEYWRSASQKKLANTFAIQPNKFSTSSIYAWRSRENRPSSQFVSSFSKSEKPAQFSSSFGTIDPKTK